MKGLLAVWLILAVAGVALSSAVLSVVAPLPLLAVPVVLQRKRRGYASFDPLEPIWALCAVFAFAYLVVPALATLDPSAFQSLPGYLDSPPTQRVFASWISALAFLALLFGYFGSLSSRVAQRVPGLPRGGRGASVGWTASLLFTFGLCAVAAVIAITGGWRLGIVSLFSGGLREAAVASFSGRGYLSLGLAALALSAPCWVLWAVLLRRRDALVLASVAALLAFILLGGVVASRIAALSIPVAILVVVHYRVRRLPTPLVLAGGVAIAGGGILYVAARGTAQADDALGAIGALGLTFDGFSFLVNALARVDHFVWGQTLAEDVGLTYLPRSLWTGKPEIYGGVRAQELVVPGLYLDVGGTSTYPVGIVAEGYVNFGIVGALLLPLVAGVLIRAAFDALEHGDRPLPLLLMAWIVPNLVTLMRGFGAWLVVGAMTMLLLSPVLLGRNTPQPEGRPPTAA